MMLEAVYNYGQTKRTALQDNKIVLHYYNYSDNLQGYAIFLNGYFHLIINQRKSIEERLHIEMRLKELIIEHIEKELILIHGKGGEVLALKPYKGELSISLFQLKNIIENLQHRGVQEND